MLRLGLLLALLTAPNLALAKEKKLIAIANLLPDPSLLLVIESLKAELKVLGFEEGKDVEYLIKDANNQVQLAGTIAREITARDPDVIVPMTTPMVLAMTKVAKQPMVFAVLALPGDSELLAKIQKDPNITGVMEQWPVEKQLALMKQITPGMKSIGMLFKAGAPPSMLWVSEFEKAAPKHGYKLIQGAVNSPDEMVSRANSLSFEADVLLLSIDGLVAQTVPAAVKVALKNKKPLYAGVESFVQKGALAGVSTSYRKIGIEAARRIKRVLAGERGIPILYPEDSEVFVNVSSAEKMGVSVPEAVLKSATIVK